MSNEDLEKGNRTLFTVEVNGGPLPEKEDYKDVEDPEDLSQDDIWELPNVEIETVKWSDLDTKGKVKKIVVTFILKPICLLALLYFFICSLDLLSSAFRLIGGKTAGKVFQQSELFNNPVAGLMMGVLVTVLVQSSSTSTSIIVTMVGAEIMTVEMAVPMIFGANIGTTVTNTIVALPQSGSREEFRRAFAGATVHDCFNWLTVLILLPIEATTHFMEKMTSPMVAGISSNPDADVDFLKIITEPFVDLIVMLDKSVIEDIAAEVPGAEDKPILKTWCVYESENQTFYNETGNFNYTMEVDIPIERCRSLFSQFDISDLAAGICVLIISLSMLSGCLILMVKLLHSMLKGHIAVWIRKIINAHFPGPFKYMTDYVMMLVGCGITVIVQSSSVFTSTLTPLVGVGLITVERMFPLTLGSNVGTTVTGILAALPNTGQDLANAMQVALCHLFFNLLGIIIWYPIPILRRVPLRGAKFLGVTTSEYRWFSIVYILFLYLLVPAAVLGLSLLSVWAFVGVAIFVLVLVIFIIVLNVLQSRAPQVLPSCMRTWDFLPEPLRSLAPYDRAITSCSAKCAKCRKNKGDAESDTTPSRRSSLSTPPAYDDITNNESFNELQNQKISYDNEAFNIEFTAL